MFSMPIFRRLLLPMFSLIIIVAAICAGVIGWAGQRTVQMQRIADLDRLAQWLLPQINQIQVAPTPEQRQQMQSLGHILQARVTLIDASGRVELDSQASAADMENHNTRPEVAQARRQGLGISVRPSTTINETSVYVARPLLADKPNGWILRLSFPRHTWAKFAAPIWGLLAVGAVAAVLLMIMALWILERRWALPVRTLGQAAQRMAEGDWTTRVQEQGAEDIQAFCRGMNRLAENAQKQLLLVEQQRADLQRLVDTLPSPIVLADAQRRVRLLNTPAEKLLEVDRGRALGNRLSSVLAEERLLELFDRIDQSPQGLQLNVSLPRGGQRFTYQAFGMRMSDGGLLLALRDISELALAVQMKTDFVANASHELRTPLAAIKIAFETLDEVVADDPEQSRKCLSVIQGHLRRLEELLRDLLDLSRLENPDLKPRLKSVSGDEMLCLLRSAMEPLAQTKNISLYFESQPAGLRFESDERLLTLILKNLIENSIKFTPGGGTLRVELLAQDDQLRLSVADTGIGIPPEHRERVFERFYQVDPARSGGSGRGTGLGLAIVKHAALALGGNVQLDSVVGQGTTVTCLLPLQLSA